MAYADRTRAITFYLDIDQDDHHCVQYIHHPELNEEDKQRVQNRPMHCFVDYLYSCWFNKETKQLLAHTSTLCCGLFIQSLG